MSIFSSILDKLGLSKPAPAAKPAAAPVKHESMEPSAPSKAAPAAAAPAPKPAEMAAKPAPTGTTAAHTPPPAPAAPPVAAPGDFLYQSTPAPAAPPASTLKKAEAPHVAAVSVVDVVSKLEAMAAKRPEKLNWKISIADLLFLLGLDNSLKARKELAVELGCPPEFISGDYSKMNIWLHKTVLSKIAENGGNIPKELFE